MDDGVGIIIVADVDGAGRPGDGHIEDNYITANVEVGQFTRRDGGILKVLRYLDLANLVGEVKDAGEEGVGIRIAGDLPGLEIIQVAGSDGIHTDDHAALRDT